ncbi:MBL fold metallo-hydrolase [Thalassobacillus devorans]|uniref:MBL fold metallo-hydrolase n=1 Tax=Thalassobacillus devorans TaxID=279813 RepID=UPI000687C509|nr:MBL fold metallo-hydrolase [Thalassobacillus devorans]
MPIKFFYLLQKLTETIKGSYLKKCMNVCVLLILAALLTACSSNSSASADNGKQKEAQNNKAESDVKMKVTLLGTGSPIPSIKRFGASTLVEVGGEKLLFDAGRGSTIRLQQLGIKAGEIDKLFLTHLHHDHTVGFPDLLITGSVPIPSMGGRQEALKLWGPTGTQNMVDGFYQAYEKDVTNRQEVAKSANNGLKTKVNEFEEGVIYKNNGIEIIAFKVDHGSMKPAFGFRVNYKGKSVVISGDTTYSKNLIKNAKGTDLIIHEVIASDPEPDDESLSNTFKSISAYHSTPEQSAKVFKEIDPKLAVYTHIISLGMTDKDAKFVKRTNELYNGKVMLGEDLMTFEIGNEIDVKNQNKE